MAATGNTTFFTKYDAVSTTATAGNATDAVSENYVVQWTQGTGATQFDIAASAIGSLSNSTNTHVLSAFPAATGTLAFVRVKELYIRNTGATSLTVTPGGSQPWSVAITGNVVVPPGGALSLVAPDVNAYPVTSGSADKFTVVSTGVTTYKLILKGASA